MEQNMEADMLCAFCGVSFDRNALNVALGSGICAGCVERLHDRNTTDAPPTPAAWRYDIAPLDELIGLLAPVLGVGEQTTAAAFEAIRVLRARGASWTDIGGAVGLSRQAAWARYAYRL
ncbi:AsnC family protein [Nocardioides exalbidus]|uniref:AsnC family protein n=1 Tax=Nocardioides exalbidus TaxID=402596 RepID=UPI00111526FC|nr:AsnC family protein [Nocardioides exalbidus]